MTHSHSSSFDAFKRLNDSNYTAWSLRMEALLVQKGLWSGIVEVLIHTVNADGTPKDASAIEAEKKRALDTRDLNKMAEARAEMIVRVEDEQLVHMSSRDPAVIWKNLEGAHTGHRGTTVGMTAEVLDVNAGLSMATSEVLPLNIPKRKHPSTTSSTTNGSGTKDEGEMPIETHTWRIQALSSRLEHGHGLGLGGASVVDQSKVLKLTMGLPSSLRVGHVLDQKKVAELTMNLPSPLRVGHRKVRRDLH